MTGSTYRAPAERSARSMAQQVTVRRIKRSHDWTEVRDLADGRVEVAVLDLRGIITALHFVDLDGSVTS